MDVRSIRERFPALAGDRVFFDGPAGSQVPRSVADAVTRYLLETNANTHGVFATAAASDQVLAEARAAVAALLGATDDSEIVFGQNMTSLTFALSRALSRGWKQGDRVVVTRLDHDANVWPWVLAAQDAGAEVDYVEFDPADCTLSADAVAAVVTDRTRLVAVGAASNAVGTVNPVAEICARAHAVGAEVFVDAVHYAAHLPMDVVGWDCDYLACSAYKFFGPHVGVLWGKRALLEGLPRYQVRPAGDGLPDALQTGTQSHEGIAGAGAAVEYIASLGGGDGGTLRERVVSGYAAIAEHERVLSRALVTRLAAVPGVKVWGIADPARVAERVPTVSITHASRTAEEVATHLATRDIFVWSGNFYALEVTTALGLEPDGMVRIGALHYNTVDEVERLAAALEELGA